MAEYVGVWLIDLPCTVHGYTRKNTDDSYTIVINARMSSEMQIAVYDHEIGHINNGDYDNSADVDSLELIRHAT